MILKFPDLSNLVPIRLNQGLNLTAPACYYVSLTYTRVRLRVKFLRAVLSYKRLFPNLIVSTGYQQAYITISVRMYVSIYLAIGNMQYSVCLVVSLYYYFWYRSPLYFSFLVSYLLLGSAQSIYKQTKGLSCRGFPLS